MLLTRLILTLAIALAATASRGAEPWESQVKPNSLTTLQGISAEQATTIVRRETGGRVLSATPLDGGKDGYKVRVLVDGGRVTTLHVSPQGYLEEDG
jgi:hypothetical protein